MLPVLPYVAALLRERAHYALASRPDRAAEVTAELVRLGHVDPELVESDVDLEPVLESAVKTPAPERAVVSRRLPRPRKS